MLCPKCGKEMKIMAYTGSPLKFDFIKHTQVIGRCEDCDSDATWEIVRDMDGNITEFNFKRYFFG